MKSTTTLSVFWLLALAYLLANALFTGPLLVVLKPLPILLLAYAANRQLTGSWRIGMVAALLFSALGDVLLALQSERFDSFVPGLAAFLVAQLVYAGLFWSHRQVTRQRLLLAGGYLIAAGMLAGLVLPKTHGLLWPVTLYLVAISAMATGAALCRLPLPSLLLGALTFVLSDSLIALNKFVVALPAATLLIMLTYYLAQWLIWHSVIRSR